MHGGYATQGNGEPRELGFVVAFPIVLAGLGIVASLWGIFLLRELEGTRNFALTAIVE